jgi:hypothetical protein
MLIPYPGRGVQPEEQFVRLSSQIDPFREIPPMPVQEMTAAVTLAVVRGSAEMKSKEKLGALAEAGKKEL